MDNEISAVMTATMSKIKEMVDTNTVVGEPITTPDDITLIPLSRVSFAFASGGSEFPMKENKNGVGCGSGADDPDKGFFSGCLFKVTGENIKTVSATIDRGAVYRLSLIHI